MTIIKDIIDWNVERKIPKHFIKGKEIGHITEEITEILRSNSIEGNIDGFADIIVYSIGAIWKCGYNPELVMKEIIKQINSRKGSWDSKINKWVKEPGETYKPDFNKCIDFK